MIFGCVDNDGARLVLNELALAYRIPYFDLGVGINATDGVVSEAGGQVTAVVPSGPCLNCMDLIDREEASYILASLRGTGISARSRIRGRNGCTSALRSLAQWIGRKRGCYRVRCLHIWYA